MKHSLFRKLFLLHVGILITAVVMIAILLSLLYTRSAYLQKRQVLTSAATLVTATMQDYLSETLSHASLLREIDRIGYMTDSRIYAIRYDKDNLEGMVSDLTAVTGPSASMLADLSTLLAGGTVFHSGLYSEELDTDVLFAGFPLSIDTSIIGGIVMFSPLAKIRQDVWQINIVIAAAALIAIFVGSLLILSVSRRMTRPIRQMQEAAVELASGTNPEPIPVHGEDEIAQLAIAFNRMQRQLNQTERIRREFIANVSHELRTPLTSIQGFVRGMMDGIGKPEEKKEHLDIVMKEVQRLKVLTEDILDLAKLQSGTMNLTRGSTDLSLLSEETVQSLTSLAEEKHITLSVECKKGIVLWADAGRIRQVLVNLIGNALKFTPAGGHILIQTSQQGDIAELLIRDNGIGIPEEERSHIFDKFHRVDKSGNPALGGSGLGLNITRTIVELHRGTIRAESSPEGGTDMIVRIPATNLKAYGKEQT